MDPQKTEHAPLVIEETYNAPVEKVWKALTENSEMKQWYFQLDDFKPEVGFTFEFSADSKDVHYRHICVVTTVEKGKKLAYSWRYDAYPGDSVVTFELFTEGDKTKIRLTHEGIDTFPNLPDFSRESFKAGWNEIIGKMLKEYVE